MAYTLIKRYYSLFIVFLVGFFLACISYFTLFRMELNRIKADFEKDSLERVEAIENTLGDNVLALKSLRNLYYISESVERKDFIQFTSTFIHELPGVEAIEWVPKVTYEELEGYITGAVNEGYKEFRVVELNEEKKLVPVKRRELYFPIYYIVPLDESEKLLGYDLASIPAYLDALIKAGEEGRLTSTVRIELKMEDSDCPGFLLILPIYELEFKSSFSFERFERLKGFVLEVLCLKEIVDSSLSQLKPAGIDILVLDRFAPEDLQQLHIHTSRTRRSQDRVTIENVNSRLGELHMKFELNVGGRGWEIYMLPSSRYIEERRSILPLLSTLFVTLLTLFLMHYIYREKRETERVSALVEKRTRELTESKASLDLAIDGAELGLWDWNVKSGKIFINEYWARMLEYTLEEVGGHIDNWRSLLHPDDSERVNFELNCYLKGECSQYKIQYRLKSGSGGWKWILDSGKIVERDNQGGALRLIGIHMDITESKEHTERLERLTVTDSLTGLSNRMKLHSELDREIERAKRYRLPLSLIMFDIDHFKSINDNFGHDIGDAVLVSLSRLAQSVVRKVDLLARWGGEEFMVLVPNTALNDAVLLAEKLRETFEEQYFERPSQVTASFGVSQFSAADDFDSFTKRVDEALYEAKRGGRNRVVAIPGRS